MSDGPKPARSRALLALIVLGIGLVIGVGLMEGTLRAYAAIDKRFGDGLREFDPMAVQIEPHGKLGYRQKPNGSFHYVNGVTVHSNERGYRGPVVTPTPTPGVTRIVIIGGSTTHGWAVTDTETIDAHMRAILQARRPTERFEVVNLGFDGFDMYQMLERMKTEGFAMQPSLVVLNEGINDVRNALLKNLKDEDPRTLNWENVLARLRAEKAHGPSAWTLAKHYFYIARAPGYVRQQLEVRNELAKRRSLAPGAAQPAIAKAPPDSGGPPYPEAADFFELNARRIVELANARNTPVLLSTPPSALAKFYADTATSDRAYWVIDAKHTQIYRDTLAARLDKIAKQEAAAGHLVRYVHPEVSERALYLDDCHLASGGNRIVAEAWVDAILPMLDAARANGSNGGPAK